MAQAAKVAGVARTPEGSFGPGIVVPATDSVDPASS